MNKKLALTLIATILAAIIGPVTNYYLNNLSEANKGPCVSFSGNTGNKISVSKSSLEANCGTITNITKITMN
jgi:hypothetical protein